MFDEPAGFFEISGGPINFPNECFVCGKKAEKRFQIRRLQFTEFYIVIIKYRRMKIKVPVCNKHFWQLTILRLLLWTMLITGPFILAVSADTFGYTGEICLGMTIVLFLAALKYFSINDNFRIFKIGEGKTTFSVKREEYLIKLLDLNNVDPTIPTV